jgi:diketogulonate reductase-like aldo/keto reductase
MKSATTTGRHAGSMELRRFGPTKRKVSVIGQGTWFIEQAGHARAIAALRLGLDQGMNHIDTAEMYGSGLVEELVGQAIAGRRDEVFLVSKVLPTNATHAGTLQSCQESLERLKTDRFDCYLLHWRGTYPLAGTITAFEYLKRHGQILSWGVSNFDVDDLEEVWNLDGGHHLVCNQVLYNLQERAAEHAVIPWCIRHGIAFVAYAPFGHGKFPGPDTPSGRVLQDIARAHKATPRQVALRFLLRWPSSFAIPKAVDPEHVIENAGAGALQLTEEDIDRIDKAFPRGPRPRELPVL